MKVDNYGQIILNESDIIELYYSNPYIKPKYILTESQIKINDELDLSYIPNFICYKNETDVDFKFQNNYFLPTEYKNLDIAEFVLKQCKNDAELQRAGEELLLYQQNNMFNLLIYLKYLVDTLRKNNIVWGVGRGSSVASFVLFLLGVHKINSLYYDIPVTEFFK